jgi:hypothetical protein
VHFQGQKPPLNQRPHWRPHSSASKGLNSRGITTVKALHIFINWKSLDSQLPRLLPLPSNFLSTSFACSVFGFGNQRVKCWTVSFVVDCCWKLETCRKLLSESRAQLF